MYSQNRIQYVKFKIENKNGKKTLEKRSIFMALASLCWAGVNFGGSGGFGGVGGGGGGLAICGDKRIVLSRLGTHGPSGFMSDVVLRRLFCKLK